ncbi:MAG: ribokinase [Acidimicrobiia bacterium]
MPRRSTLRPNMGVDVVVIGSVNRDISVMAPRLPRPGETIIGTHHFFGAGGKGANQAVAAARLGARVAMVGRVGADEHGESLVAGLVDAGVDTTAVGVDEDAATGIAIITIDEDAENTIVGSPGANMRLMPEHVEQQRELISSAAIVLTQLEVPTKTVAAAAAIATGTFCLNPAPARSLDAQLLREIDVLIPNRSELGILAGAGEPEGAKDALALAHDLETGGAVVVTLGADGAVGIDGDETFAVQSPKVQPVDPTGAGDAFCGALAQRLSLGESLQDAVRWAVAAGALATTRHGAQAAMPTREEVEALLAG